MRELEEEFWIYFARTVDKHGRILQKFARLVVRLIVYYSSRFLRQIKNFLVISDRFLSVICPANKNLSSCLRLR